MQFSWRWNGSTISPNLGVIWQMTDYTGEDFNLAKRPPTANFIHWNSWGE